MLIVEFNAERAIEMARAIGQHHPLTPPAGGWTNGDIFTLLGVLGEALSNPGSRASDGYADANEEMREAYEHTAIGEFAHAIQHCIDCAKMLHQGTYFERFGLVHTVTIELTDGDDAIVRPVRGVLKPPDGVDLVPPPESESA